MYRVREDGLQTANAFRNALHSGDAKRGGAAARVAAIAYASSRDMPACLLLALRGSHSAAPMSQNGGPLNHHNKHRFSE